MPCLFSHSLYPSFQWNNHTPLPLLQEIHHLYFLLLRVMVAVAIFLISERKGFLVTHYGISFADFLSGFPLDPVPFDLQYFMIWPFLLHLWQVTSDLTYEPPPEPLLFPLRRLLKSIFFRALLTEWSMATLYAFVSGGFSWDFYLLVIGSHRFESTRSQYSHIASCTRYW